MKNIIWLLLFVSPLQAQLTEAEKKKTLEFVASLYDAESGGYRVEAKTAPGLRATSGAVRAIGYLGAANPNLEKARDFLLKRCRDGQSGTYNEPGAKENFTSTCIGLMTVVELKMIRNAGWKESLDYLNANAKTFEDVRLGAAALESIGEKPKWLDDWIKIADEQLNNDGTAGKGDGKARDTASVAAMKLRLGYPIANKAKVIEAIVSGQRTDGGWGKADAKQSDLETTYRVMRCLMLLKEKPKDVKKLNEFLGKCRNNDGGYSVEPGGASTMSGVYYATAISKWMK